MNTKYSLTRPPANTPKLYETENNGDSYKQIVFAHYFVGNADWYVLEYSAEDDLIFGYAQLFADGGELGYTSMVELEEIVIKQLLISGDDRFHFPVRVEYDEHWKPRTLEECLASR